MTQDNDYVTLKWGTIKSYKIKDPDTFKLVEEFFSDGMSLSAAADKPNDSRKTILCQIIERIGEPVYLDWDAKYVSVEEAKKYVMEYET
jgi:hypothetical protein